MYDRSAADGAGHHRLLVHLTDNVEAFTLLDGDLGSLS